VTIPQGANARQTGSKKERGLVLDGDMTPALTVTRSLGRLGLDIVVASHEDNPIAGYSKYARKTLTYPNPLEAEHEFLQWCKDVVADGEYSLIVPVTERTVVPLQAFPGSPAEHKIAIAPNDALAVVLDKHRTMLIAIEEGIRVPESHSISDMQQLAPLRDRLQMPVVIKPARSIGSNDKERIHLSVEYAFDLSEVHSKVEGFLRYGDVLLQEFVRGQGVGIELIASHGEVLYAFQHLRLHEVPLTGGGSSLRTSVPIEPELLDASKKLISRLKWHGVAMVEFKWQADKRICTLMEINGRFWGSLPLATAAGADFPAMLYELSTHGRIFDWPEAKSGVYCRKLSSDIAWHESVWRREAPNGMFEYPSAGSILRDWLRIFLPRHHFDVQQWSDPIPGFVDIKRILQSNTQRLTRLLAERSQRKGHHRAWKRGRVKELTRNASQLLFLCYGNINRSALAEKAFKQQVPDDGPTAISAGFHEHEGRPADPTMIEVASALGIDLGDCSSRRVNPQMVDDSDVIFVMELTHYQRLCDEFPSARKKTFLLNGSERGSKDNYEIADPYGKSRQTYEACARQVDRCVTQIARYLSDPR